MSTDKIELRTDGAPQPIGGYSQGIRVGDLIFVSGQGPVDPATGVVTGVTIAEQTAATLKNLSSILASGGATLNDVVKATVHLADLSDFDEYDRVYKTFFDSPRPVRTTVGSALMGILVEIDVIAHVPAR
ncbi:Rid family detoxifying hydrolase [Sphaerisporangium sp. NPDC088356]|uniref:RidA family protein n=1 Tax=Sphaerisporangium sp. NPDC088356 TaxID=3154871 RepID=UPI0034449785